MSQFVLEVCMKLKKQGHEMAHFGDASKRKPQKTSRALGITVVVHMFVYQGAFQLLFCEFVLKVCMKYLLKTLKIPLCCRENVFFADWVKEIIQKVKKVLSSEVCMK